MPLDPNNTRAIIGNWDDSLKHDDSAMSLVCLTKRERFMLAMVSQYIGWPTRWNNAPADSAIIRQKGDTIIGKLVVGCRLLFRQNPIDSCELQYSWDEGQSWSLAFDFGLCLAPKDPDLLGYELLYEKLLDEFQRQYDPVSGIESIAPELVYGDADDFNRDVALCWAINGWIDMVAEAAYRKAQDSNALGNAVKVALFILALIVSVATFGATAWILAGIAIASGMFENTDYGVVAAPENLKLDHVRKEIACRMYDNLKGSNVQFSDWQAALAGLPYIFPFLTLFEAVEAVLPDEKIYLTFVNLWSHGLKLAKAGAISCPCESTFFMRVSFDYQDILDGGSYVPIQNPFHEGTPGTLPVLDHDANFSGDTGLQGGEYRRPGYASGKSACIEITLPQNANSLYMHWHTSGYSGDAVTTNIRSQVWCYDEFGALIFGSDNPSVDFDEFIKRSPKDGNWHEVAFNVAETPGIRTIIIGSFSVELTALEATIASDYFRIYAVFD